MAKRAAKQKEVSSTGVVTAVAVAAAAAADVAATANNEDRAKEARSDMGTMTMRGLPMSRSDVHG